MRTLFDLEHSVRVNSIGQWITPPLRDMVKKSVIFDLQQPQLIPIIYSMPLYYVNTKSFGYVAGMNNSSFNAIKVFLKKQKKRKANVTAKTARLKLYIVRGFLVEDL